MASTRKTDKSWVHYVAAAKASRILVKHGYEAYVIGGAVRDIVLGTLPKDFDLVTNATPSDITAIEEFGAAHYKDTAQAYGVSRVRISIDIGDEQYKSEIEIATYRRDIEAHLGRKATKVEFTHLEDDLKRRDFTINALALDLQNDYLIDYVDGLKDIDNQIVRFIGEPEKRIIEDPLRVLRGIRLKNQLEFKFESATHNAISQAVAGGYVQQIAVDRLRQELTRMLLNKNRLAAIADLDSFGILKLVLPEVVAGKGVSQPPQLHGEGDVYEHTLLAVAALPPNPSIELAWATLLHDIGKPTTISRADRIRFNDHYSVGAELARQLLKRLNFSKRIIEHVSWMIHNHLAIDDLPKMRPARQQRMMSHPAFNELLQLHKADAEAALSQSRTGAVDLSEPDFSEIEKIWEQYQLESHTQDLSLKAVLGIDGNWLKKEYQLQGPQLGKILASLDEAYLDGELTNQAAARAHIEKMLRD